MKKYEILVKFIYMFLQKSNLIEYIINKLTKRYIKNKQERNRKTKWIKYLNQDLFQ